MIEARGDFGLPPEAVEVDRGWRAVVRQNFQCDLATKARVLREVDLALAPTSEWLKYRVWAERRPLGDGGCVLAHSSVSRTSLAERQELSGDGSLAARKEGEILGERTDAARFLVLIVLRQESIEWRRVGASWFHHAAGYFFRRAARLRPYRTSRRLNDPRRR
jgi:hypothetical protein